MNLYEYQRSRPFTDLGPRSLKFNIFKFLFLRNYLAYEARFYVEPPWDGWTKVWSNGLGHMTKMATMPIYDKNLNKSSTLEPKGWWPWKLICSTEYSSTTKFVQVMTNDPGMTLTYFTARSNLVSYAFAWEKGKPMFFSEPIVVYDVKVGRYSQLNENMKLYEYQRSRSFIELCPNHSDSIF